MTLCFLHYLIEVIKLENNQWYSNKDLFEQINELKIEMRETRQMIKKYNGLYSKVDNIERKVTEIESQQLGKMKLQENIIAWGGWIFSLITLLILMYSTFNSI